MIDIKNLSIQFTGENLFENVNLKISRHDKIALVGSNGTGKSTFLKLLFGLEKPETGSIIKQKGINIGYLPQEINSFIGKTLFEEVKTSLQNITTLEEREKLVIEALNDININDEDRNELIDELGEIQQKKEELDFYTTNSKIEKILIGLGFRESDFSRMTDEFSGGWQMRIQMAKILLADNDLILLDEPTNHLDIDSLEWLISFLQTTSSALIVVSHDRHFVTSVTNKTLEIYNRQINFYSGNYLQYLTFKEEREKQLVSLQKQQEKKIKELERFIERFRYKATKAKQVQSRIKQLEKIELVEILDEEKKVKLFFPEPSPSGIIPVELINISHAYQNTEVFKNINLQIERGDKIAIVGPNGAGKTTLTKIIASKINPTSGKIIYGHNTIISYYEQDVADSINPDFDLIDALEEINSELPIGKIRTILGSFLFAGDDVFKKVKVLSGGEKSRIALARLLLTKSNFIILDEPTNHLDYTSKEILQKALIDFNGTILIVSHDIDFLKPIVNKVYEMKNMNVKIYLGGIENYLIKKVEQEKFNDLKAKVNQIEKTKKDQKRIEAELRQKKYNATKDLKNKLEKLEEEISKLELEKSETENQLADSRIFSNPELAKSTNSTYEKIKSELENKYETWTHISHQLEEIEKQFNFN
ncbi:MAG: ABC-F family ATP-binding cassette domain-containing protein [Melioribacteraceae bacterium]|nr:ABC-F family ATP-binding cassette domain-containing protein [Melioribacteraceae bacterium]